MRALASMVAQMALLLAVTGAMDAKPGEPAKARPHVKGHTNCPWEKPRWVALGDPTSGWLLLQVHTRKIERPAFPAPPYDVSVSHDGAFIVYTTWEKRSQSMALYGWKWREPGSAPRPLGVPGEYNADPSVAPDGSAVFFTAHPIDGTGMSNDSIAQIFRVSADGTGAKPLTSGQTCHFTPAAWDATRALFVDTDCVTERRLIKLDASEKSFKQLMADLGAVKSMAIAPDQSSVLVTIKSMSSPSVAEVILAKGTVAVIPGLVPDLSSGRPVYGRDKNEIVLAREGSAWAFDRKTRRLTLLAKLREGRP